MNPFVESVKVVWENPRYVFVNGQAINDAACKIAPEELKAPAWRDEVFPQDDDQFVEFIGVANAINFCFEEEAEKKFDVEYPTGSGRIQKGAFAMAACIKRALDAGIPILEPKFLRDLSILEARRIFRCHSVNIPMLKERVKNLRETGKVISDYYILRGFKHLLETCDYTLFANGHGILEILVRLFDSYWDGCLWNNGLNLLQFQKRAQLFALMYQGRALSSGGRLPLLKDIDRVGPIADSRVPTALRYLHILIYDHRLSLLVDNGIPLGEDSPMWIELRAQTINAMCQLLIKINELRSVDKKITMMELDYPMWLAGRNAPQHSPIVFTTAC